MQEKNPIIPTHKVIEELRNLILRKQHLMSVYQVSNELVYLIEYNIRINHEKHIDMRNLMNKEIKKYKDKIYGLNEYGEFFKVDWIESTDDYNHNQYNLHHFIPERHYNKYPEWYKEQGIEQKLLYVSVILHEQIEKRAIKNKTEEEFIRDYKVPRSELICLLTKKD